MNEACPGFPMVTARLHATGGLLLLSFALLLAETEDGTTPPDDADRELDGGGSDEDPALLRASHLSEIFKWPGVQEKETGADDEAWAATSAKSYPGRVLVRPGAGNAPVQTLIHVPAAGLYRIWLGYLTGVGKAHPVTLALDGGNKGQHTFGAAALPGKAGPAIEDEFPLRFDSGRERNMFPLHETIVWESWEARLAPGRTALSLSSPDRAARVDALFITRSQAFVPGGSRMLGDAGSLSRVVYRFKVHTEGRPGAKVTLRGSVQYIVPPSSTGPYHAELDKIASVDGGAPMVTGQWSAWLDATQATASPGQYVNASISVDVPKSGPLAQGRLEVQCAWCPHPGAVIGELTAPVTNGVSQFLIPAFWGRFPSPDCPEPRDEKPGSFAVRPLAPAQQLRTHRQELEREIAQIPADALQPGTMPSRIRVLTLAKVPPSDYDLALPLLRKTGFNLLYGVNQDARREYGFHPESFWPHSDRLFALLVRLGERYGTHLEHYRPGETRDEEIEKFAQEIDQAAPGTRGLPHWYPMGDEIGPVVSRSTVNWIPSQRRAYHEYLRQVAGDSPAFFGVSRFDTLEFPGEPSQEMTRAQRRLYYHSARFRWDATAQYYARVSAVLRRIYPAVLTMANYSPYTVFYLGAGMDHAQNSFALPRANACTGHWGEDWLAPSGVTSMAGIQTEGYLASVLRCGASRYRQPFGFYLVWKMGDLDRKMALLVSHGVRTVHVYYWGPRYLGGGSPDASSHRTPTYAELNRVCRALGPADLILAEGQREPAQAAILYNRTDETWNSGSPWCRTDRIYTFLALRHAHVPVDLLLEEDITEETLRPIQVIYLAGTHIRRDAFAGLKRWVERGGILVAGSSTALRDEYDDPLAESSDLFGARQKSAGASSGSAEVYQPMLAAHEPIDTVSFDESPLTPALAAPVVGRKSVLVPKDGKPIARYADGSCAGVVREHGKGMALLLGVMPGYLYAHNAPRDALDHPVNYTEERRELIARPARSRITPTVTYTDPLVELSRFDHETGIAVILTDFSYRPGRPGVLSVRTDRAIQGVSASLAGPLPWRRDAGKILIECPVPSPVDVVILR